MTWAVTVREVAAHDIASAIAWYETEAPEQVERLDRELHAAIRRLAGRPTLAAPFAKQTRREHLRVFPYQVWYLVHGEIDMVEVIALVHDRQSRRQFEERA